MGKFRWLLIVATLLLFSGCVTQKRCERKFPPSESVDSIYIYKDVVRWRDTVIYKELPPLVIERYVYIKDTLRLTGKYSKATAWVVGGNIFGNLKEGTRPVKIEYKIKEVEVEKKVFVDKEKVVNVRYIPIWAKYFIIIGVIACIYVLIRIYLFLR